MSCLNYPVLETSLFLDAVFIAVQDHEVQTYKALPYLSSAIYYDVLVSDNPGIIIASNLK